MKSWRGIRKLGLSGSLESNFLKTSAEFFSAVEVTRNEWMLRGFCRLSNRMSVAMHESFRLYVEALDPLFQRLIQMRPVTIATLPRDAPSRCIYLFSEAEKHLYVGRTHRQSLRKRLSQHSNSSAQHNQAVFAFKLAREMTGKLRPSYTQLDSRKMLEVDPGFKPAFLQAKDRVRKMELRYVEEADPLKQTLLEIYVGVVLRTPYNDFDTH